MFGSQFSRISVTVAILAVVGVAASHAATGGAIFSPGTLHAADSTPARLGDVQSHLELSKRCGACHAPPGSARPMAVRCLECHADVRKDFTDTSTLHGAVADARRCTSCHTEHHGAQASLTSMTGFTTAHDQLGFALDAHRRLDSGQPFTCESCHAKSSFTFEASGCESCHREYQAPFIRTHVAEWGADCQSCHDGRDRFSRGRFSHDSTDYPLTGKHQSTACAACHTGVTGLSGYAQTPADCASCHTADDKHKGSLGPDCASCHTTASWEGATFDHDVFPIDHGESGRSPCKTCHLDPKNYKSYTCYGCHEHSRARVAAEHRGEVRTQNLDDCLECHAGGRKEGREGDDEERRTSRRRER